MTAEPTFQPLTSQCLALCVVLTQSQSEAAIDTQGVAVKRTRSIARSGRAARVGPYPVTRAMQLRHAGVREQRSPHNQAQLPAIDTLSTHGQSPSMRTWACELEAAAVCPNGIDGEPRFGVGPLEHGSRGGRDLLQVAMQRGVLLVFRGALRAVVLEAGEQRDDLSEVPRALAGDRRWHLGQRGQLGVAVSPLDGRRRDVHGVGIRQAGHDQSREFPPRDRIYPQ
eukprot:gene17865-24961_t